jgi:hypothetical protein
VIGLARRRKNSGRESTGGISYLDVIVESDFDQCFQTAGIKDLDLTRISASIPEPAAAVSHPLGYLGAVQSFGTTIVKP